MGLLFVLVFLGTVGVIAAALGVAIFGAVTFLLTRGVHGLSRFMVVTAAALFPFFCLG